MSHGRLSTPGAVTSGTLFGAGTTAGGHTFLCTPNPIFPLYKCAQWADGQGLTNAYGFPLTVNVMGDSRLLIPGGVSPSGVTATTSTRDEAIVNAIEGRPPAPGISPLWGVGALGVLAAGAWWFSRSGKKRR